MDHQLTLPSIDHHFKIATHNGTITVQNKETGEHRTFLIKTQPEDANFAPGERIVSLLTGPETYTGWGFIKNGIIRIWRKKLTDHHKAYRKLLTKPENYDHKYQYLYQGACRRCNRALTNPESIEKGIGPICEGR